MTLEEALGLGQAVGFLLGFMLGALMAYGLTRLCFDERWH